MTLTQTVAKNIIRKLLAGDDYRAEVVALIDIVFLQFAVNFFKKVVNAKVEQQDITADWYKDAFLDENFPKEDIAINAGLNMKTINNMRGTTTKQVVIDTSRAHYDDLYDFIQALSDSEDGIDLTLTLRFNSVSVDLNIGETLIVINTLAVKRSALRGGLWSTAGKRVEKPLMQTLCMLYGVAEKNYRAEMRGDAGDMQTFVREVDFYLIGDEEYKCEVKLIGRGNPESADAVIARGSRVFVADKLSQTNKDQLDSLDVLWVELRTIDTAASQGFRRFKAVLEELGIPHAELDERNLDDIIESILSKILRSE